jgi:hypothetical protein
VNARTDYRDRCLSTTAKWTRTYREYIKYYMRGRINVNVKVCFEISA